jgi:hypothetical protein
VDIPLTNWNISEFIGGRASLAEAADAGAVQQSSATGSRGQPASSVRAVTHPSPRTAADSSGRSSAAGEATYDLQGLVSHSGTLHGVCCCCHLLSFVSAF